MKIYTTGLPDNLRDWALQQRVFFTASAPLVGKHVNCSPKGLPGSTFTVFDPFHAAYIDTTGSGSETISHIYENGRVTIMFCSFDTLPRIMRFFCRGSVVEWDDPRFESTLKRMGKDMIEGARAVILLEIFEVQTSCGTGVPLIGRPQTHDEELKNDASAGDGKMAIPTKAAELFHDRDTMKHWARRKNEKNEMLPYRRLNNARSLDGLTGMKAARRLRNQWMILEDLRVWLVRVTAGQTESFLFGIFLGILLVLAVQQRYFLIESISTVPVIIQKQLA